MTSEPVLPSPGPADPAGLPPLFASPPVRPGRVRGDFTMRGRSATQAASVPLDEVRRRHRLTSSGTAPVVDHVTDQGEIDWGLVTAFRTLVAGRLAQGLGGDWRARGNEPGQGSGPDGVPMDRTGQEHYGYTKERAEEELDRWAKLHVPADGQLKHKT